MGTKLKNPIKIKIPFETLTDSDKIYTKATSINEPTEFGAAYLRLPK